MNRWWGILIAALLVAGAARAEPASKSEFSISLGAGGAYDVLGLNLAYRSQHVEGYLGLGWFSFLPGIAAGARWFLRPDGDGFFVGINLAGHTWKGGFFDSNGSTGGQLFWATLTPGYRATFGSFFVQAALGGGIAYWMTSWTTPPSPTRGWAPSPDAALAAGFRF
jgi:hypothetical protein